MAGVLAPARAGALLGRAAYSAAIGALVFGGLRGAIQSLGGSAQKLSAVDLPKPSNHWQFHVKVIKPQFEHPQILKGPNKRKLRCDNAIMGETRIHSCFVVEAGGGDPATTEAALSVIELLGT